MPYEALHAENNVLESDNVDPDLLMTWLPSLDQVERPKCFATMDNSSDVNNFPGFDHEKLILPTVVIEATDAEPEHSILYLLVLALEELSKILLLVILVWIPIRGLIRVANLYVKPLKH